MFGAQLLVSISFAQLGALALPGSVFAWRHLRDAALPPQLALALRLVVSEAAARRTKLAFVARPAIFTHGASRAWLDARIGEAADHVALCDGHALPVIPGLRNHMFFVGRGQPGAEAALARLVAVAPELFERLAGQVNGALSFRLGDRRVRPPTLSVRFARTPEAEEALVAPFLCHPGNPAYSAVLAAKGAVAPADAPADPRPVHYVPLSAAALADGPFVASLSRAAQRAVLGAAPEALLLGLPQLEQEEADTAQRIGAVLKALAATGLPFPSVSAWGVRFTAAPPPAKALQGGRITLHGSTPFWRFGADLFAAAREVAVAGSVAPARSRALIAGWLGREVALHRSAATPGNPAVARFAPP